MKDKNCDLLTAELKFYALEKYRVNFQSLCSALFFLYLNKRAPNKNQIIKFRWWYIKYYKIIHHTTLTLINIMLNFVLRNFEII